jgi:hypothetical protein
MSELPVVEIGEEDKFGTDMCKAVIMTPRFELGCGLNRDQHLNTHRTGQKSMSVADAKRPEFKAGLEVYISFSWGGTFQDG